MPSFLDSEKARGSSADCGFSHSGRWGTSTSPLTLPPPVGAGIVGRVLGKFPVARASFWSNGPPSPWGHRCPRFSRIRDAPFQLADGNQPVVKWVRNYLLVPFLYKLCFSPHRQFLLTTFFSMSLGFPDLLMTVAFMFRFFLCAIEVFPVYIIISML